MVTVATVIVTLFASTKVVKHYKQSRLSTKEDVATKQQLPSEEDQNKPKLQPEIQETTLTLAKGSNIEKMLVNFGAENNTAKQIAEYVAYTRLGLDASFVYGDIIIEELVCIDNPGPLTGCKQLQLGDTITSLDGEPTPTLLELSPLMEGRAPGDIVSLTVKPAGTSDGSSPEVVRRVQLIADPDTPTRAIIGFIPADTRTVQLPFEVGIDTDQIGGPSAGLAFTLALLDELTPGDLMGGVKVAASGTISEDESVGAIGALAQKAVAVKAAGAKVFLVPKGQSEDELAAARRVVGSSVRIEPVANLTEALAILESLGGSGISNATIDL